MKLLNGGCRVYSPEDGQVSAHGSWTERIVVSPRTGANLITQAVSEYSPGFSPALVNPNSEEVLYVAAGKGACRVDGFIYDLRPGAAIYIPPSAAYSVENAGPETMRIISSCCPEDPQRQIAEQQGHATHSGEFPSLLVHEEDRKEIRAGQDRLFRFLVHADLGCKTVTQFVGWIPKSKAPFHKHPYEESIFILEGRGILHLEGQPSASEFGPGASIYLPVGVVHCLENFGPAPIRLLGVFHPSGSPGAAYEQD